MNQIVNDDKIEKALHYLAETDITYGQLKGSKLAFEYRFKVTKGLEFLSAEGTIQAREAKAYTSEKYMSMVNEYESLCAEFETINAKRKRAELTVSVWQTENANRRKGTLN